MSEFRSKIVLPWEVPESGFTIRRNQVVPVEEKPIRSYRADSHTGLFMDLVTTGNESDSVIAFANRWGSLWYHPFHQTLKEWYESMDQLKRLVEAGSGDELEGAGIGPRECEFANNYLDWINFRLAIGPKLIARPGSLISLMFLQAAVAAIDGTKFTRCSECRRHIPITPKLRPGPRVFCSSACRYANFAARKMEAMTLLAKGQPVDKVAEAIGSSPETVQEWATKLAIETGGKPRKRGLSLDVSGQVSERERLREVARARAKALDADPVEPYSQLAEDGDKARRAPKKKASKRK